jgi:hypothetical protein
MLRIGQGVDNVHRRNAFSELLFKPEQTLRFGFAWQALRPAKTWGSGGDILGY